MSYSADTGRAFAALSILAAVLALWTLLAAQGARRQFALDSMSEEA